MNTSPPSRSSPFIHLIWGLVIIALAAGGLYAYHLAVNKVDVGIRDAGAAAVTLAKDAGKTAVEFAGKFHSGTITQTFTSELAVFQTLKTGNLEVALTEPVMESFRRSDQRKVLWDWISLGETVSEVRVPATYRYHVQLDGPWKLDVVDGLCIVIAPPVQPSLPIAIHTDRMEKKTSSGWARFDKHENLAELERTITPTLEGKARDLHHLQEARDKARSTIAAFVKAWLISEAHWQKGRFTSIIVAFPDEPFPSAPLRPTLSIDPAL